VAELCMGSAAWGESPMHWNYTKLLFVLACAGWLLTPCAVWSMDVNQFYQRFVEALKESRYPQLEQQVKRNPGVAEKSLEIIQDKIRNEKESQKKAAYGMIVRELEELSAVTGSRKDCELAGRIVRRGEDSGIPDEALEAFRRAVRLCPDSAEALLGWADTNKRLGRFDDAVAGYEKVLAMHGDAPDAILGMGEVLYSAGLYEHSVPFLEKALKAKPDNKKAQVLLASSTKQVTLDTDGIIPADEIVDRLRESLDGGLMCMCPVHAELIARIRFRSITFSTDSTRLDATAREQLGELATALKTDSLKAGSFLIEGHADTWGAKEYNVELSARRAEAVKRHLLDVLKVDPGLISVQGVGASRSWTSNETRAGRRANRRIEVLGLGASRLQDTSASHARHARDNHRRGEES
jgi:outer membrane protein OmpA-like peptidoglycan-associated protein